MKKNIGKVDKAIRTILALVFAILYFTNIVTGTWGIVLLVLTLVLLITSVVNFCPLYTLFGCNTCKVKE